MRIELLADHKHHVATVAQWFFGSWNAFYEDWPLEDVEADVRKHLNRKVPLTFVALEDADRGETEPVGVVSLVDSFLPTHAHLTPWLANLYVRDDRRSQGVAMRLVKHALGASHQLGIERVHAALHAAEDAYVNEGWEVIDRFALDGAPIAVIAHTTNDIANSGHAASSDAS